MISGRTAVQRGWMLLDEDVRTGPLADKQGLGPTSRATCVLPYLFSEAELLAASLRLNDLTSATRDVSHKALTVDGVKVEAAELIRSRVAGASADLRVFARFRAAIDSWLRSAGYYDNKYNLDDRTYTRGAKAFFAAGTSRPWAELETKAQEVAHEILRISELSPAALNAWFADPAAIAKLEAELDDLWSNRRPSAGAADEPDDGSEDVAGTLKESLADWVARHTTIGATEEALLHQWLANPVFDELPEPTISDAYDAALLAWVANCGFGRKRKPVVSEEGVRAWRIALSLDAPRTLLSHLKGYGLSLHEDDAAITKPAVADGRHRARASESKRCPLERSIYRRLQPVLKGVKPEWVDQLPSLQDLAQLEITGAVAPLALRTVEARAALTAGALLYRDMQAYLDQTREAQADGRSAEPADPANDEEQLSAATGALSLASSEGARWARNAIRRLERDAEGSENLADDAQDSLAKLPSLLTPDLWQSLHNADYRKDQLSDPLRAWGLVSGKVTGQLNTIRKDHKDGRGLGTTMITDTTPTKDNQAGDDPVGGAAVENVQTEREGKELSKRPGTVQPPVPAPSLFDRVTATADHVIHILGEPGFWAIFVSPRREEVRLLWEQACDAILAGTSLQALGQPELAASWDELIEYVRRNRARYA